MTINEMCRAAYENSKAKGFHDDEFNIAEKLALIHSEVSEALEEVRGGRSPTDVWTAMSGKPEGFPIELADVVIRIGDLCGRLTIDLEAAVERKMQYNATRAHKHGKQF